eukprot:scaffold4445_cov262-Chaetoceros_neogracile.AAC.13
MNLNRVFTFLMLVAAAKDAQARRLKKIKAMVRMLPKLRNLPKHLPQLYRVSYHLGNTLSSRQRTESLTIG